jgi:hypothetical protein
MSANVGHHLSATPAGGIAAGRTEDWHITGWRIAAVNQFAHRPNPGASAEHPRVIPFSASPGYCGTNAPAQTVGTPLAPAAGALVRTAADAAAAGGGVP